MFSCVGSCLCVGGGKMMMIDLNPGSQVDPLVMKGKRIERPTQRHIVTGFVSEERTARKDTCVCV